MQHNPRTLMKFYCLNRFTSKKIFFWKTVEIFGKLYIENKLCHVVPPAKSVGYRRRKTDDDNSNVARGTRKVYFRKTCVS